jgi:hypothetical protein
MEGAGGRTPGEKVQESKDFRGTGIGVRGERDNYHMWLGVGDMWEKDRESLETGRKVEKIIHKTASGIHGIRRRRERRDQAFLLSRGVNKRCWRGGGQGRPKGRKGNPAAFLPK